LADETTTPTGADAAETSVKKAETAPAAHRTRPPQSTGLRGPQGAGQGGADGGEGEPRHVATRTDDEAGAPAPAAQRRAPWGAGPGRGGRGAPRGRERDRDRERGGEAEESRYEERVVKINRCATVVKGGRRFSFSAVVVLGDRCGSVGLGFGKANEVPPSVEKAMKDARKNFVKISVAGTTIPHRVVGTYRSSRVVLVPAAAGTGVIAGAAVRAVVECAGIKDILTKVHGSTNPLNVVKATMNGLKQLRSREEVTRLRGVQLAE
jgi:small subunit ribosomal protein S5